MFFIKSGDFSFKSLSVTSFFLKGKENTSLFINSFHVHQFLFFFFNFSGVLKATEQLDYETSPFEKFKIVVVDQSGHSCNSDVFLKLNDVNDNTPSFDQDIHTSTVRENASQSVVIAQVRR